MVRVSAHLVSGYYTAHQAQNQELLKLTVPVPEFLKSLFLKAEEVFHANKTRQ